ncbi:MAG: hypothetical protein RQ751_11525 [Longimicrobiales bacterium]|nr:hypothetical protein [Longimicrobiales bacterium]
MKKERKGTSLVFGAAFVVLGVTAACSTTTEPDEKPTRADIQVTGESTVPLRLVVSTDFFETLDQVSGVRAQVFNSADTTFIETLPFERTVQLTDLGSIVVDLSNPSEIEASVRLQVTVDSGQEPFDRSAIMSQGGALRYVFTFFAPTF